jgi:RNA polymerase sigma-70 factor (ECF subfamily)
MSGFGDSRTSATLLDRLKDRNDHDAWRRFEAIYSPQIRGRAMRLLGHAADADDLAQEVRLRVVAAMPGFRYDPKLSFRTWLFTVVRNTWRNWLRHKGRQPPEVQAELDFAAGVAADLEETGPQPPRLDPRVVAAVMAEADPTHWKAFWETAVEERAPADVAAELGLTPGYVCVIKLRVARKLRERLAEMSDGQESP